MAELRLWLSLLKLRVVVLLQVTAIAAILAHDLVDRQLLRTMVVGNDPRSWAQTLETALVVLLGGSMASGGSMAINMWYDRDIDPLMARTYQRPLPSGELAPGAVLAYGVTVCAAGVALLAQFATPLAGAIAGFSALFYVLVYTVWLKRRTPQNIVIGGLAGALSPLVGWTAAGGDPLALLARLGEVLAPDGRVVVELAAPGVRSTTRWARLELAGTTSRPFRWSVVGVDGVLGLARATGWAVTTRAPFAPQRWLAVLERRP